MSSQTPPRLRVDDSLPRALRNALRELPNAEPTHAQLAALRGRLGLRAAAQGVLPSEPLAAPTAQSSRLKSRRLRRTVAAFVLFPVAATAAVGTVVETVRRASAPAVVASSVVLTSKPVRRAPPAAAALAASSHAEAEPLPDAPDSPDAPERERTLPPPVPSARATSSALRLSPVVESYPPALDKPSEVSLLQRANAALKTDPAAALALAAQHRTAFPNANLSQERDVITIKAWLALGNVERARAALASFEQAHPHSAYTVELRQAVK